MKKESLNILFGGQKGQEGDIKEKYGDIIQKIKNDFYECSMDSFLNGIAENISGDNRLSDLISAYGFAKIYKHKKEIIFHIIDHVSDFCEEDQYNYYNEISHQVANQKEQEV